MALDARLHRSDTRRAVEAIIMEVGLFASRWVSDFHRHSERGGCPAARGIEFIDSDELAAASTSPRKAPGSRPAKLFPTTIRHFTQQLWGLAEVSGGSGRTGPTLPIEEKSCVFRVF